MQRCWACCSDVDCDARRDEHLQLHAGPSSNEPLYVLVAEEFLALRYVALIRAVLIQMKHLMVFVSTSFVFAVLALNSYPFAPRKLMDWGITALLFLLGAGVDCRLGSDA
jgi:hypothetical protein